MRVIITVRPLAALAMVLTVTGCGKFNAQAMLDEVAASSSNGAKAKLKWNAVTTNSDASPLTDLSGYKVHYGETAGTYTETLDVGNVTETTISTLTKGKTYYFTVKAYDTTGNASTAATEVSKTIN